MTIKIAPIPDLPDELLAAAQAGRLVPFVGAGVSRIAGCPGWDALANASLQQMVDAGRLSYAELEQCQSITAPRIKLSMAELIARKHGLSIDYKKVLERPGWQMNSKGLQCYGALGQLGQRFVTTNYDGWLDYEYPTVPGAPVPTGPSSTPSYATRLAYYDRSDFTAARFREPNTVIHLHGSLQNPGSMILTMRDYISHYANDRGGGGDEENQVLTFLEHLFEDKTVLFVGYGLEDLDILEHVVQKARGMARGRSLVRHYMLQPYFSYEQGLAENMERYFREECGIALLPYQRDSKNYDQLIDVLTDYARRIPAADPMVLQDLREMEGMI
ncbi:SIR2 family protein [Pseudomonadota bacterium]